MTDRCITLVFDLAYACGSTGNGHPQDPDVLFGRYGVETMVRRITIRTRGQGLHDITGDVEAVVLEAGIGEGLCTVMIQHTSASLTIQENADPSARHDLEDWLNRLVPEDDPRFTHTLEGPDDMPSHIKAALTSTTLSVPILDGRLCLGTWQGIYLWEHRRGGSHRHCVIHVAE
jgi:secondary thiamine-phosphate synthase enzyme